MCSAAASVDKLRPRFLGVAHPLTGDVTLGVHVGQGTMGETPRSAYPNPDPILDYRLEPALDRMVEPLLVGDDRMLEPGMHAMHRSVVHNDIMDHMQLP